MSYDQAYATLLKENNELKQQLAQFHEALERSRQPDWEKWLNELATSLESASSASGWGISIIPRETLQAAARQLRYMATPFTLKANFVPTNLTIKKLQAALDRSIDFADGVLQVCEFLDNSDNHYTKHTEAHLSDLRSIKADMESFMREHNIALEKPRDL